MIISTNMSSLEAQKNLQASSAKLASYPLPILPALAILIVDCWRSRLAAPPRWLRWSPLAGAAVSTAGGALYLLGRRTAVEALDPGLRAQFTALLLLAALAMLAGGILALRGRFWAGILAGCLAFGGLVVIVNARLVELGLNKNVRSLALAIAAREQPGDLVVATGPFVHDYTLQLTLRHRIGLAGNARELGMGFFAEVTTPDVPIPENPYTVCAENLPANPWLFTRERLVEELRGKRRVWLVAAPTEVDALIADGLRLRIVATLPNARLVTNVE